jgi:hypothetical protein
VAFDVISIEIKCLWVVAIQISQPTEKMSTNVGHSHLLQYLASDLLNDCQIPTQAENYYRYHGLSCGLSSTPRAPRSGQDLR